MRLPEFLGGLGGALGEGFLREALEGEGDQQIHKIRITLSSLNVKNLEKGE